MPKDNQARVRFAPEPEVAPRKRRRQLSEEEKDDDDDDDFDDDDFDPKDTEDVDGTPSLILNQHKLLEAKRERRLRQLHATEGDDANDTVIDNRTSLATEDIPIEPFHMKQEQEDGTGYFDGDTYVFRKRNVDDEPDAWLESLQEGGSYAPQNAIQDEDDQDKHDDHDDHETVPPEVPTIELYQRIVTLLGRDDETVMNAIQRYGAILEQERSSGSKTLTSSRAKEALDTLTQASNYLLLREGLVDIYQQTRQELAQCMPKESSTPPRGVLWEYLGNQDQQIHGPFTTAQMKGWIQQGYFVGESAVQARSIDKKTKEASIQEDLLNDLLNDDDEEAAADTSEETRGEWIRSDNIDFDKYA